MTLREHLESENYLSARKYISDHLTENARAHADLLLELETYLEENPSTLPPRILLAELYIRTHQFDLAADELEESLPYAPRDPSLLIQMGELFLRLSRPDEAIGVLTAAIKMVPPSRELFELLGEAHFDRGDHTEAVKSLERADQIGSPSRETLRMLSDLYLRTGEIESASHTLYRLQQSFPEILDEVILKFEEIKSLGGKNILWMIAELYQKALRPDAALEIFTSLLGEDSTNGEPIIAAMRNHLKIFPQNSRAEKLLAEALLSKGLFTEAATVYQHLMENETMLDDVHRGLTQIITRYPNQLFAKELLAEVEFRRGNYRVGLALFQELVHHSGETASIVIRRCQDLHKILPHLPEIQETLGKALLAKGNLSGAEEAAEEAIRLRPGNGSALEILGDIYLKQNLFEKAMHAYRDAMQQTPLSVELHLKLYRAHQGNITAEIDQIHQNMADNPPTAHTYRHVGMLLVNTGDLKRAEEYFQKAIELLPRAPLAQWELGRCLMKNGRFDQGVTQLLQAAENWEASAEDVRLGLWNDLAVCFEALGDISNALLWYEKILAKNIHFGGLQRHAVHLSHVSFTQNSNRRVMLLPAELKGNRLATVVAVPTEIQKKHLRAQGITISFGQNHNLAGIESIMHQRLGDAMEQFELARNMDPTLYEAWGNIAVGHILAKNLEEGEKELHAVLEHEADQPIHWHHLSLLHRIKEDPEAALGFSERAISLDSAHPYFLFAAGDLRYLSGRVESAFSAWTTIPKYHLLTIFCEERRLHTGGEFSPQLPESINSAHG